MVTKKLLNAVHRPVNPSPAALITSIDESGRHSHSLIQKTGEFVINLTTTGIVEKVDRCGSATGRGGLDKFQEFGLTPLLATYVKPPLIEECPVNLECEVAGIQPIGDHDLVLGEVLGVHVDEDKIDASGRPLWDQLDLLVYLTGSYWSLGKKLGEHGFTSRR